ncbi:glycosyltransferase [Williamsia sp. SKLECPSW1]
MSVTDSSDQAGRLRGVRAAAPTRPRIAIAHDYLTQRGGAEKVVLSIARAFPDATIYTTLFDPENTYPEFSDMDIRVSPMNRLGFLRRNHRAALPLLPFASSFVRPDADIVIASSSGWAHAFPTAGRKVVYCHSPARWLYQEQSYLGESASWMKKLALVVMSSSLRRWDRRAALGCDSYYANSNVVRERISSAYGISAPILPAPVSLELPDEFEAVPEVQGLVDAGEGYYLCISRLLAYKNVDAVIDSFRGTDRKLVVVGRGPERDRLLAGKPDNVTMVSDLSDRQIGWLYHHCTAVMAASYEDYGLTPLEGAAHGKPSILLRFGGFLDTAVEDVTAVYFDEPEPAAIRAATAKFERSTWNAQKIVDHVSRFSDEHFAAQLHDIVENMAPSVA